MNSVALLCAADSAYQTKSLKISDFFLLLYLKCKILIIRGK